MPSVVGQGVVKAFMCIPKKLGESGVLSEGTTTSVAEALSEVFQLAWTVVQPAERPLTRPLLLTLATAELVTIQPTVFVTALELPLLSVKVATNCCCAPGEMVGIAGVTVSPVATGAMIDKTAAPAMEPELAEIVVVPTEALSAIPAPFMAATAGNEDVQLADCVMSCVDPSLNVAVAVNC